MSRINCNVTRDLLPSYMDQICSEDSIKLVEEHLKECQECRNLAERMEKTEFVAEQTDVRQIDYMRGVRLHFAGKGSIGLAMLTLCMVFEIYININSYRMTSPVLYYIMMPAGMAVSCAALSNFTTKKEASVWRRLGSGLSLCLTGYCILFSLLLDRWTETGWYPFGIEAEQIGPFVYAQFVAVGVLQSILCIVTVVKSVKTSNSYYTLLNLTIMGANLALASAVLLKNLYAPGEYMAVRNRMLLVLLVEGIAIQGIVVLLERKRKKVEGF